MIWISVEDRLPEEWDRVLICDVTDETEDYETGVTEATVYILAGFWTGGNGGCWCCSTFVTRHTAATNRCNARFNFLITVSYGRQCHQTRNKQNAEQLFHLDHGIFLMGCKGG